MFLIVIQSLPDRVDGLLFEPVHRMSKSIHFVGVALARTRAGVQNPGAPVQNERQDSMKIIFEDGSSEECSPSDQRKFSVSEIKFNVDRRDVPQHLELVWKSPPTYARLMEFRCDIIRPGQWIMTAQGMKQVAKVER